jgi:tripeptidyl-peptidase I
MFASLFLFTFLLDGALGVSRRFLAHTVVEERKVIPNGWNKRSLSDAVDFDKKSIALPMRINLRQSNLDRAEDLLMDVSSPSSENYSNHYTPNQIVDLFAPAEEAVASVMEWLIDAGLKGVYSKVKGVRLIPFPHHCCSRVYSQVQAILVNVTVAAAEDLLHTNYHVYEHIAGHSHVASTSYSVPQAVREHVDFITPTLHFDVNLAKRGPHKVQDGVAKAIGNPSQGPVHLQTDGITNFLPTGLSQCDIKITPDCIRALYQLPVRCCLLLSWKYATEGWPLLFRLTSQS